MMEKRQKAQGIKHKGWNPDKSGCCCIGIVLLAMLSLAGCQQEGIKQRAFGIGAARDKVSVEVGSAGAVRVGRVTAAKPFGGKAFVYRMAESEFEIDYYNHFIASPENMIREQAYDWFFDSGMFEEVLRWDDSKDSQYKLRGHIKSLYADFAEKDSQSAVMCIEFELLRSEDSTTILKKEYKSEISFDKREIELLVGAYEDCLGDILGELESDIKRVNK